MSYDVAQVMREMAKLKRQRELVRGALVAEPVKAKLLADLDEAERKLAAGVLVDAPKGASK